MKTPCNFFFNNKTYFLINLAFLFCVFFTAVGQTRKFTQKERKERDSLEEIIINENMKKTEALGDYIFSDTANLYQYEPKKFSLATLDSTSSGQEKFSAIRKVEIYRRKHVTVKFIIKEDSIYIKSFYHGQNLENEISVVDVDREIFLVDLNSDGVKDIIYYPNMGDDLERQTICILIFNKQQKKYNFIKFLDGVHIIENIIIDVAKHTFILKYFKYGCCADYSDKVYEYKMVKHKGKFNLVLQSLYAFSSEYSLLPKKFNTPKTSKLTYKSRIYSKPIVRDSRIIDINKDSFTYTNNHKFIYTYCIGEIPKGTTITELATYTNPKGEKWRFVVLKKGYQPKILVLFQVYEQSQQQIYAWLPPEKYDRE
jgi:hypothetical protein